MISRKKTHITARNLAIATTIMLMALALFSAPAVARDTDAINKEELGLLKLVAVYPEPGSIISDKLPMITADASSLESHVDTNSVKVFLNGADVTSDSEIAPTYIVYQPPTPLTDGIYEVRISASNIAGNTIEPLTWTFTIGTGTPRQQTPDQPAEISEPTDNTTGRLSFSVDSVSAFFTPNNAVDTTQLFREKEGAKFNTDLTFTNSSDSRTITGTFHRETQDYTDVEQDRGRLNYYGTNYSAALGYFWFSLSDLTITGTELAGLSVDKTYGRWDYTFFAGRTQDPSSGSATRQNALGTKAAFNWNQNNTTAATFVQSRDSDKDDSYLTNGTAAPETNSITAIMHTFSLDKNWKFSLEEAHASRNPRDGSRTGDFASRFTFQGNATRYTVSGEAYNIGANYLPVSEGGSKYLKSNREGFKIKLDTKRISIFNAGGEYESYDTDETTSAQALSTERSTAFIAISSGILQTLSVRKSYLTSGGVLSDTDSDTTGVNAVILLPSYGVMAETRISAGWQTINYSILYSSAAYTDTETEVLNLGLSTAYKDILSFSSSYSDSDSDILSSGTPRKSRNRNYNFGLNWNIIPFKFFAASRYEIVRNTGTDIDNQEDRLKNTLKYVFDEKYSATLSYDTTTYRDEINPVYDYKQRTLRTGMEMSF